MSIETGVVIGRGGANGLAIHWHLPEGRNSVYLPDSRNLWDVLWENRGKLVGFAHSHPGEGIPSPSWEDITTFSAIEKGLGCRLTWWICSEDKLIFVKHAGTLDKYDYTVYCQVNNLPSWLGPLRQLSYQQER